MGFLHNFSSQKLLPKTNYRSFSCSFSKAKEVKEMEINVMCEALRRQVAQIDRKNAILKSQWDENEIEIVRIEEAIKELEKAAKEYGALGLKTGVVPL